MSKDHSPGGFDRPSGYKSDLEKSETDPMVKSVNTSFGSANHNVYVMRRDHCHEHFFYDPATQRQGWHGHAFETKNNHPPALARENGGKTMEERNAFLESLRVDKATIQRTNEVGRSHGNATRSARPDDGGRERGDDTRFGREPGLKGAPADNNAHNNAARSGVTPNGHTLTNTGTASSEPPGKGEDGVKGLGPANANPGHGTQGVNGHDAPGANGAGHGTEGAGGHGGAGDGGGHSAGDTGGHSAGDTGGHSDGDTGGHSNGDTGGHDDGGGGHDGGDDGHDGGDGGGHGGGGH